MTSSGFLPSPPQPSSKSTAGASTIRYQDIKTDDDRWLWHAETYAFRRVVMNQPYTDRTSPCDPQGVWFNEELVAEATIRYERHYGKNNAPKPLILTDEDFAERAEWARMQGYPHWNAYFDEVYEALLRGDEGKSIKPFIAWCAERRRRRQEAAKITRNAAE